MTRNTAIVRVAVLGSTGSVGRQTLDVIASMPDQFQVVALAAGTNQRLLAEQARQFQPSLVALDTPPTEDRAFPSEVIPSAAGLMAAATHPDADLVVVATSGHAAIDPTFAAIGAGKTVVLANKETIVCAGELLMPFAYEQGVEIRPADSEHSAIWQCLGTSPARSVSRLIITASGGPFRTLSNEEMTAVTAEAALAHPTWSMGSKITIDSATMMNKGLEVIEAHWLFGIPYEQIEVLVHPESIVHSLVEFVDGSQLAQLGLPDMRLPIQYALTSPERQPNPWPRLALAEIGALHFENPDEERFPALTLAQQAGMAGSTYPTVLSTADEVAVAAFLAGRIRFLDIPTLISRTLDRHAAPSVLTRDAIAAADAWARATATELIARTSA